MFVCYNSTIFSAGAVIFHEDSHLPPHITPNNRHLSDHEGDTEVDSNEEWFTEPQPADPPGGTSSIASSSMLVEVCSFFFLLFFS